MSIKNKELDSDAAVNMETWLVFTNKAYNNEHCINSLHEVHIGV